MSVHRRCALTLSAEYMHYLHEQHKTAIRGRKPRAAMGVRGSTAGAHAYVARYAAQKCEQTDENMALIVHLL